MSDTLLGAIAVVSAIALAIIIVAAGLCGQPPRPPRAAPRPPAQSRSARCGPSPTPPIRWSSSRSTASTGNASPAGCAHRAGDPALSQLRPGMILLVSFDPQSRDRLSLADDVVAVRAGQSPIRAGCSPTTSWN